MGGSTENTRACRIRLHRNHGSCHGCRSFSRRPVGHCRRRKRDYATALTKVTASASESGIMKYIEAQPRQMPRGRAVVYLEETGRFFWQCYMPSCIRQPTTGQSNWWRVRNRTGLHQQRKHPSRPPTPSLYPLERGHSGSPEPAQPRNSSGPRPALPPPPSLLAPHSHPYVPPGIRLVAYSQPVTSLMRSWPRLLGERSFTVSATCSSSV